MSEILIEKRERVGILSLNHAKAMNALNLNMCQLIDAALDQFASDVQVEHVVLRSTENGRFFCAGGDIRSIQGRLVEKNYNEAENFFATEYRLNRKLARFPKPIMSFIDGIVMGGGVGISGHGKFRVVTDNTVFAMPEVAIGFFPDVGASRILAQLPGKTGAYLAVTGERIKAADMMFLGLATHYIASNSFEDILTMLSMSDDAKAVLDKFALPVARAPIEELNEKISHYFDGDTVEEIHGNMAEWKADPFAAKSMETISTRCPTSMAIALKQLEPGALSIEETLQRDFRIACRVIRGHDFPEGVRALLIDKDQAPRWQPANFKDLQEGDIDSFFDKLPDDKELSFS